VGLADGATEEAMLEALLDEIRTEVPGSRPMVFARTSDAKVSVLAGRSSADAADISHVRSLVEALPVSVAASSMDLPRLSERSARAAWFHGIPSVREAGPLGLVVVLVPDARPLDERELRTLETVARTAGALLDARRAAFVATHHRKLHKELSTRERLAMVGAMAAGVAHEINSPLAAVSGNVAVVYDEIRELEQRGAVPADDVDELVRALGEAKESTSRVASVVRDLVVLAREGATRLTTVDLRHSIDTATRLLRGELRHRARLTVEVGPDTAVRGDDSRLVQILVHLLRESIEALPDNRPDRHEILIRARAEGSIVALEIHDTGPRPTEEGRDRAFEPFFLLRGRGSALGLAVCQDLAAALEGRFSVLASPLGGACFRVELRAAAVKEPAPEVAPRAPSRVLVVDDEPTMCAVVARMLRRSCVVTTFTDAPEALASVARGDVYDVVLCDVMMPGMSGMEFLEELTRLSPSLARRTGFLTAGAFTERARTFLQAEGRLYADKPVDIPTLTRLVQTLAEH
jgi:signal transduction histidine kinase